MISSPYNKYFQKSTPFLYPLTGLSRKLVYKPVKTYLQWPGHSNLEDFTLIGVYEIPTENKLAWETFCHETLFKSKCFKQHFKSADEKHLIVVFDMSLYKNEFASVISGKYSTFSDKAKNLIQNYYGSNSSEYGYIETYLYPSAFFSHYAKMLNVEEDLLRSVGELCEKADLEQETLTLQPKTQYKFQTNE